MNLVSVYRERQAIMILYDLLKERTAEQSISHTKMPTCEEHAEFVRKQPYLAWYLIQVPPLTYEAAVFDKERPKYVGSVYLTKQREVGIFIFKAYHGQGYAKRALQYIRKKWPGRMLAHVNPQNEPSKKLFEAMGSKVIQLTYEVPEPEGV